MAQQNNVFTAFWMNTTTAPGTPLTGLSATATILELDGTVAVNNLSMTEIGLGHYKYVFTGYAPSKDYVYHLNPNSASAYIESGVTTNIEQLISEISRGGGGYASQAIQSSVSTLGKRIEKKIEDEHTLTREFIVRENNETHSHIDLAKEATIAKIEGIDIPESVLEEKEAKKALKIVTSIDKKLSGYIDSELKEKDEIGALASEFTRMELEDRKAEKEQAKQEKIQEEADKKKEEEQDTKELELIKAEFDKQEEQDKIEQKKQIEQEIKAKEQEVAELEKELKKL